MMGDGEVDVIDRVAWRGGISGLPDGGGEE